MLRTEGALTLKKCDVLWCPFLEVSSGSLAGLAFKAENEMPALLVMQPRARDFTSAKQ